MQGRLLDRVLNRPGPQPVLPAIASKFGGRPYCEHATELNGRRFLGQINFSEVAGALGSGQFPRPSGMPDAGLLAVDLTPKSNLLGAVRWYADPRAEAAVEIKADQVATYEAAITFKGSWSLRGLEWFDSVPSDDKELWNWMNELETPNVDEDARGGHKLFGHPNEVLNEHYGFVPVAGRSGSIREYALIWRIDFDQAARFDFGTNWLYVIIHTDDLARGAFENAVLTGANA
jgi:hypothetical protein